MRKPKRPASCARTSDMNAVRSVLLAWAGPWGGARHADGDAKPKVYALISAMGSEISYVRQRLQVGSNFEPYYRNTLPVPDSTVDAAVLRGLERAILQEDPDAKRVYLRLAPTEVRDVLPYKRGDVVPERALAALARVPDRKDWDRIILVTPRYLGAAREGMGTKLHGIGVYVQPLGRGRRGNPDLEMDTTIDPDTVSPEGEKSRSNVYIAPYFYAQVWIIDAKTMQVLESRERYGFQRLYDPNSAAIDVSQSLPVQLAPSTCSARALPPARRGPTCVRMAFSTPTTLPIIAVATIWLFFYPPGYGLLERLAAPFGIASRNWLGSPDTALACVTVVA